MKLDEEQDGRGSGREKGHGREGGWGGATIQKLHFVNLHLLNKKTIKQTKKKQKKENLILYPFSIFYVLLKTIG